MRRDITPEDLALYALNLLDTGESFLVEQFVATSPEARQELALLRGDLATLALTTPAQVPPAQAKQQVLKNVLRERRPVSTQPSPLFAGDSHVESRNKQIEDTVSFNQQVMESPPHAAPEPQLLRSFGSDALEGTDSKPKRGVWAWGLAGLGWTAAAAAAFFGYVQTSENSRLQKTVSQQSAEIRSAGSKNHGLQAISDALTSSTSQHVVLTKSDVRLPETANVTFLPNQGTLIMQANHLDVLPVGKIYELWLIPAGASNTPLAVGTFKPDISGNATLIIPLGFSTGISASKFGITVEDQTGAAEPTLPILMIGQ